MKLKENYRRHVYTKSSPMQDLPICCYRYGRLENVQAWIVTAPPTKVLLDSFFCTHAFVEMQENALRGLKEKRYAEGL